jgi:hypothetical protein
MIPETTKKSTTRVMAYSDRKNSISLRPTAVYFERTWRIMMRVIAMATRSTMSVAGNSGGGGIQFCTVMKFRS